MVFIGKEKWILERIFSKVKLRIPSLNLSQCPFVRGSMGKIQKIGDEYYVEFHARGLLYQQKAGRDLKKAEELLRQIEGKIAKGELQTIVREIDIEIFFVEFLKFAQTQHHPHTVRRLNSTIDHFSQFLKQDRTDVKKISQVTPRVIEDYKTSGISSNPKKLNLTLLLLREILEYGIKTGHINDNPTLHIRLAEIPPGRSLEIAPQALTRILENASEFYRSIFSFLRQTGLRLHELEYLTWQEVDFNRSVIFVKYREIPLNATALMVLKGAFRNVIDHKARVFCDEDGQTPQAFEIAVRFEKAARKAGLSRSPKVNQLRHSFACELLRMRISFLMIGKLLGVHDIAKLMFYATAIPVSREDIVKDVYGA